jgi:site-specific DNA-methyltransferase (adenine-specific)
VIVNIELSKSKGCLQKDLWATPEEIFEALNDEFNFTLDPCCTKETNKCDYYFTPDHNGLKQTWEGERVFCNPPYSRGNIDKWMEKCCNESSHALVVALIPVSSSAKWWHRWVLNRAEIRFYRGRIKFEGAPHTAPFSSAIAIYGIGNKQTFIHQSRTV